MHTSASPTLNTPILLLVFNRPNTTERVFEAIRRQRPRQLFVAADGPRPHVDTDAERCDAARKIATRVDWDCEVKTLFRKRNLGCRVALSSAITWFFQQVEHGIILEDDILPAPDFFPFCQELLLKYQDNPSVMLISGNNFQMGKRYGETSYFFSRFAHIWGWATWRSAWALYEPEKNAFASLRKKRVLEKIFPHEKDRNYWSRIFEKTLHGEINSWAYIWQMSIWNQEGIAIAPNVNLASNAGFDYDATHTSGPSKLAELPLGSVGALVHPDKIVVNEDADAFAQRYIFSGRLENAAALALDVATAINEDRADEGATLATRFLTVHKDDMALEWLRLLAWNKAGKLAEHFDIIKDFIKKYPQHEGIGRLLASLEGKSSPS